VSRIEERFSAARAAGRICFVPGIVAGYPDVATSERLALAAIDNGADLLEMSLPYSDPLADGATVQRAGAAALAAGSTFNSSLGLVGRIAAARPDAPIVVMGYANQFMGPRGMDVVAGELASAGAAGAIVADLTPDEGQPLEEAFERSGLNLVYLVAPTSTDERVTMIGRHASGFVYCVSLTGVTGARSDGPTNLESLVRRVKRATSTPVAVGFGVSRPEHVRAVAASGADGAIVASALVDALGADGRNEAAFTALCRDLAAAA
jgi:tryptophan synthase alpha chain